MDKVSISETEDVFVPAPQSRMHKFLLAYYMILAQNYDSARNFSILQLQSIIIPCLNAEELKLSIGSLELKWNHLEYNALLLLLIRISS